MGFKTSLISHWPLNEESGNAIDAHGAYDLTDNGSVGFRKGVLGVARDFEAGSSQSFSIADNADLSTGNIDFTLACWVIAESLPASVMVILSKYHANTTTLREYMLHWNNAASRFRFTVTDGTTTGNVDASNFGLPVVDTPYHIICWHDSVNNQIGIQVNGIAETPTSYSAGAQDSAEDFRIGARNATAGVTSFWDGRIEDVWFWKRVLSAGERLALYAGGSGLDERIVKPVFQSPIFGASA